MDAFGFDAANQIRENIRILFHRVKRVCAIPMTHDEFSSLFIPKEHREMYRDMSVFGDTSTWQYTKFQWGGSELMFEMSSFDGKHPLLIPRSVALQHDAPPELVEKITSWLATGGDASGDFGRVTALFERLNKTMTRGQIRFIWPSILAILGASPVLAEQLSALQELRVPAKTPELLPGLLQACRKTAASISTACLIPPNVEGLPAGEGKISTVDCQHYDEQGLGVFTGCA